MLDAGECSGVVGADFDVDLVGLELDDRFPGLDMVALLFQPARDARLDDRFAQLRNDNVCHGYACLERTIDGSSA